MEEKRKYSRTDLAEKVTLSVLSADGANREIEVTITDVSETGIGFTCHEQLMIGDCYKGNVVIWTHERIEVILKIVRSSVIGAAYEYGAIFVGMENSSSLRIKIYQLFNNEDGEVNSANPTDGAPGAEVEEV